MDSVYRRVLIDQARRDADHRDDPKRGQPPYQSELLRSLAGALEAAEDEVEKAHEAMTHWLGEANRLENEKSAATVSPPMRASDGLVEPKQREERYTPMDVIDSITVESDEGGFELVLTGDFVQTFTDYLNDASATEVRLSMHSAAWDFANSKGLAALEDWAEQGREVKREMAVAVDPNDGSGYEPDDPKSPGYFERMVDHAE